MYHALDRQNYLDTHIFTLVHNLAINKHLVSTDSVAHSICGIRSSRYLNLTPLLVGGDKLPLSRKVLELLVNTLFLNATLTLNKG